MKGCSSLNHLSPLFGTVLRWVTTTESACSGQFCPFSRCVLGLEEKSMHARAYQSAGYINGTKK